MSSINNLIQTILKGYNEKSKSVTEAAKAEASEIIKRKSLDGEKERENILREAEDEAARMGERILLSKKLEIRDSVLAAKRESMDRIFSQALEKLNALSANEFQKYLHEGLKAIGGGGELILPKGCGISGDKLQGLLNDWGIEGVTLHTGGRDISGGFILIQNGIEHNRTFEALIGYRRQELEGDIVGILF